MSVITPNPESDVFPGEGRYGRLLVDEKRKKKGRLSAALLE
jgi:hypothetical protein